MKKALFFIVLVFISCSDLRKEDQLGKLKMLQDNLSKSHNEFQSAFIDSLHLMTMASSDLERELKQNYKSDKVDIVLGKRVDDYKRMRRMFGSMGRFGSKLRRAYVEQEKQLQTLFIDIENGFGERNKYDLYIDVEKEKNEQIFILLEEYLALKNAALEIYEAQHLWISNFVAELKSKNE
tara:strand:- start:4795 stop:5334 length:540 start_codon:yes stop_codon:yes gene_type:complete